MTRFEDPSRGVRETLASPGRVSGSFRLLPPAVVLSAAASAGRDLRLVMRNPENGGLIVVVFRRGEPTMVFFPGDGRSLADLLVRAGIVERNVVRQLVEERPKAAPSLHKLVIQRTGLAPAVVQRFLNYQARQRLLDVLVWRDGFFQLEDYPSGEETEFSLELPSLPSLADRAESRSAALPALLAALPASPANVSIRRRRRVPPPSDPFERRLFEELREAVTLPTLLARTLIDDDLVIDAVLRLASENSVALQPLVKLVEVGGADATCDLRSEELVREIYASLRGGGEEPATVPLWLVVVSADYAVACDLVERLGPGQTDRSQAGPFASGVCRSTVRPSSACRVTLLAVRAEALTRGALYGVLGRCDGVVLLRSGTDGEEMNRLQQLHRTLAAIGTSRTWSFPVLGLELGAGLRRWDELPDAVVGLPDPERLDASGTLAAILEGVLAAVRGRTSSR
jgi:hypothetical protein